MNRDIAFRSKIGTFIDFPLEDLDLGKYVLHVEEGKKYVYDCIAVSNHIGNMNAGHYTAHARNVSFLDRGAWSLFDDSRVSPASPADVVSGSAYLLFYKRRVEAAAPAVVNSSM